MMNAESKIKELMNNREFAQRLISAQTPAELVELMDTNGLQLDGITPEEAFELVQQQLKGADEELAEDDLEEVSGGYFNHFITPNLGRVLVSKKALSVIARIAVKVVRFFGR